MWLNQTIYPDYRIGFIEELRKRLNGDLHLSGGRVGFFPSLVTSKDFDGSFHVLKNRYLWNRALLWQDGLSLAWKYEGLVVTEFNLRSLSTLILAEVRRRRGLPTVFWGHVRGRRNDPLARLMRRILLARCSGFICYTASQARLLAEDYPHLPMWVAPNAIYREEECIPLAADNDQILDILYVGRLVKEKKPALLVEAFAHGHSKSLFPSAAKLVMCGDGPEREYLIRLAEKLKISEKVEFAGHVSGRDALSAKYSTAVCSVSPGYVGLSATQSFSFGVPMIIARTENHSPEIEACVEGSNCLFFESDDVVSLSNAIVGLVQRRKDWLSRRSLIAARIRSTYTFEKMADAFVQADSFFHKKRSFGGGERKVKICLYWDYYQAYHCARLRSVLEQQDQRNAIIVPLALQSSGRDFHTSELTSDVASVIQTLSLTTQHSFFAKIKNVRTLNDSLQKNNPDVLFTSGYTGWPTLTALQWAGRHRKAAVLMFETLEHDRKRWRAIEAAKKVVVSRYSAAFTGGQLGKAYLKKLGISDDRIFVGYDAVDNRAFAEISDNTRAREGEVRARLGLPPKYFLAVGRMIAKKGFDWLLESYAIYISKNIACDISLVIVGDGPESERLRSIVARYRLNSRVHFPGYKTSSDIARYMSLAEAFVMPSVREEQWGLVINEAMAAGTPVLASSICGATPELVVDGVTGFACQPNDREGLAKLLSWIELHPEHSRKMGVAAREHVEKCSLRSFADGFYASAFCALELNGTRKSRE